MGITGGVEKEGTISGAVIILIATSFLGVLSIVLREIFGRAVVVEELGEQVNGVLFVPGDYPVEIRGGVCPS